MAHDGSAGLRGVLLVLVAVGSIGLIGELLLLEHFDEWTQWAPLVVLAATLPCAALLWLRPARWSLRAFRWMMITLCLTGAAGLWLHFAGNRAFEREIDAQQDGWLLLWRSLRGATPALAPGAMIQLGLLGLVLTWRHPATTNATDDDDDGEAR
jgi:hypothetical protein